MAEFIISSTRFTDLRICLHRMGLAVHEGFTNSSFDPRRKERFDAMRRQS